MSDVYEVLIMRNEVIVMVYAYVLENVIKHRHLDNSEVFGAIKVYKLSDDYVFSDPIDCLERPELRQLKETVRSGDTIVLRSLGDLCNDGKVLIRALEHFHNKGVQLISMREPNYVFNWYIQALCEQMVIEREWKEVKRVKGIEKAKKEGRMGRKSDPAKVMKAIRLYNTQSFTIKEIQNMTGVSSSTLYRALKSLSDG